MRLHSTLETLTILLLAACDAGRDDSAQDTCDQEASIWYADMDEDGYGDPASGATSCGPGEGRVADSTDCDDANPDVHPGAEEIPVDGIDQDCDGGEVCYADGDGDGYGTSLTVASADVDCSGAGESSVGTDCDDGDPAVNPGATEAWYDGVDQDCDGNDTDADGDGYPWEGAGGDDCDDENPFVNPGMEEDCENGVDDDCDGSDPRCPLVGTLSLSEADARFRGGSAGAHAGRQVAPAGDFDGDGILDVAISSPYNTYGGRVQVMTGPFSGEYDLGEAGIVLQGDGHLVDWAGVGLDGGLDTNGDGIGAVVVGAVVTTRSSTGYGFLVEGPVSGTVGFGDADCAVVGEAEDDWAGYQVATAGDVTGDDVDDWLVAASHDDTRGDLTGAAYLVSGTRRGAWSLADVDAKIVGENAGDKAGWAVESAGDVDGDGLDDVLVGAPGWPGKTYRGAAYLLYGPVSGTAGLDTADAILRGERAGDWFGNSVAPLGDMDGDGLADFLLSASGSSSVYVFHGPLSGETPPSAAEGIIAGEEIYDERIPVGRDGAGDVDGDGTPDILIGACEDNEGGYHAGAAWLVYGPVKGSVDLEEAGTKFVGEHTEDLAGFSVAGVGDIDQDGFGDFLVGAILAEEKTRWGLVYLLYGAGR